MNLIYIPYSFWDFCSWGWFSRMHHFQIWTFQSRFPKRMCFLSRFILTLHKNHILFENSACEGGFLKCTIFKSGLFRQPIYRFPKRMWFLSRFTLNLHENHIPFENSACEGGFLKSPFLKSGFSEPISKKNVVFWVDSGLISPKTMFFLRILLVKVVFSKHQRADYADYADLWTSTMNVVFE